MKKKLLILPITLLLVSCGSNVNEPKNDEDKGSKYDTYLKEPTEDYYREYESASVRFYESTEDMHIFNKKELKLSDELFYEWKTFTFEYINYGNRKNLKEIGEGASISNQYYISFNFGEKHDFIRFEKKDTVLSGYVTGDVNYYNNKNPKVSDELIQKKNELVEKIDKELENIESTKYEHYC